jgi:hypothetical protein
MSFPDARAGAGTVTRYTMALFVWRTSMAMTAPSALRAVPAPARYTDSPLARALTGV